MIDLFSKFGVAAQMPEQSAQTVADSLLSPWVLLDGAPGRLVPDQRSNFESVEVQNLSTIWRIDKVRTTPYDPAANGACERLNQRIKRGLQKILNEKGWRNDLWS